MPLLKQNRQLIIFQKNQKEKNLFCLCFRGGHHMRLIKPHPKNIGKCFRRNNIEVRPNVPEELREKAREDIAGYYAHMAALDDCMKDLLAAIKENGIEDNTIFVFTSDHGDMLYSHGNVKKQQPWDESLLVPFILRYPEKLGTCEKTIEMPINTPDILPTLLGLSGIEIPETVEGTDYSKVISGEEKPTNESLF